MRMGSVTQLADHRPALPGSVLTDTELVAHALEGDERACERLFRRHANAVSGLAFRLCPHEAEAEDLVQEAFARAFERLHHLRDHAAFGAWVRAIVVRMTSKQLRRARIARRIGLSHSHPYDIEALIGDSVPPETALEIRRLYAHLRQMPAGAGVALVLKRVEGMTLAEIAAHMGVSEPTVKRRIKRAEALLREGPNQ